MQSGFSMQVLLQASVTTDSFRVESMNVCDHSMPISSQPAFGPHTCVNEGAAILTVDTEVVDIVCVIDVVISGATVNHISPVSVVVDGAAFSRPASTDGSAPIQEQASDSSDLSIPDRISSAVSHDDLNLRRLPVASAEDVVNVVVVLLETMDLIEVIVTVLVGTSVRVLVLDITSKEVTTASVATPSAEVQYA